MRFDLRRVVVMSKARDALPTGSLRLEDLRELHQSGDRGDVSDETAQLNEQAVQKQFALLSTHAAPAGERITVFTRAERSFSLVSVDPNTRQEAR